MVNLLYSIILNLFFKKGRNIKFNFDMFHELVGNLDSDKSSR